MCFALQKDCLAFFIHDSKHVFWSGQSSGISIPNGDSRYDGSIRGTIRDKGIYDRLSLITCYLSVVF